MYFVHTSTCCPPLFFIVHYGTFDTERHASTSGTYDTSRGFLCIYVVHEEGLSRGVRISPAKGRAREVGDGRDEGAAIRSFSC